MKSKNACLNDWFCKPEAEQEQIGWPAQLSEEAMLCLVNNPLLAVAKGQTVNEGGEE